MRGRKEVGLSVSRIEHGRTRNLSANGGTYVDEEIAFERPFSSAPHVVCCLATASTAPTYGRMSAGAINVSNEGFTIRVWNDGGGSSPAVSWIAVGR